MNVPTSRREWGETVTGTEERVLASTDAGTAGTRSSGVR